MNIDFLHLFSLFFFVVEINLFEQKILFIVYLDRILEKKQGTQNKNENLYGWQISLFWKDK